MTYMKIGLVLDDTLDSTDGVQQYVLTLGSWLSAQGHDIHYLVGSTERNDIAHVHSLSRNLKVRFNGNRMSTPLPGRGAELRNLLLKENFDVLHVQMPYSPWLAHRLIRMAPQRTAVVGTFHIAPHSSFVRAANKALGYVTRASLNRFTTIVSVSAAAEEFARSAYGIRSQIIPNAVKLEGFQSAQAFAGRYDRPLIVFLGRLVPRKGCRLLLEAAAHIRDSGGGPFQIVVCGRGPLEPELKDYVRSQHLEEHVEFAGFVSEEDKARYLKSADIAVFPSTGGESFGIVLVEAMAAGRPVVLAADNPGYASVLSPRPELLFPVNDVPALASKLQDYMTHGHKCRAALRWQKGHVKQFDVAVVGNKMTEVYRKALRTTQDVR